jgi:hypothetical protein
VHALRGVLIVADDRARWKAGEVDGERLARTVQILGRRPSAQV